VSLLFVTPLFLFVFLPLFVFVCVLSPRAVRNVALLTVSLAFYSWAEPIFVFMVLFSAIVDWWLARIIGEEGDLRVRRVALWLGIAANGLLLGYFKVRAFSSPDLGRDAGAAAALAASVAIPLGVSFIALEKITYLVDVYRGASRPTTLLRYLTYVFLFPKLLAGPIVKYREIARQIDERVFRSEDVREGFVRFGYGLAKKLFLADVLATTVDRIFALPPQWVGGLDAWLGATAFALQVYYDFSAYSDMAIGLSRMAGFRLRENFNMPFRSVSIREFWQRWHVSFYNWVSQYLFIPLNQFLSRRIGGPYGAGIAVGVSLLVSTLASGIWHGANWTFVVWGLYTGLLLALDSLIGARRETTLARAFGRATVLLSAVLGAVLFRSPTLDGAFELYGAMFRGSAPRALVWIHLDFVVAMTVAIVLAFVTPSAIAERLLPSGRYSSALRSPLVRTVAFAALLLLTIGRAAANSFHPFLYFRF